MLVRAQHAFPAVVARDIGISTSNPAFEANRGKLKASNFALNCNRLFEVPPQFPETRTRPFQGAELLFKLIQGT